MKDIFFLCGSLFFLTLVLTLAVNDATNKIVKAIHERRGLPAPRTGPGETGLGRSNRAEEYRSDR